MNKNDPGSVRCDARFSPQGQVGAVAAICAEEFVGAAQRLEALLDDVSDLYAGRWSSHEACAVTYHNLDHALAVALALARMIAGWNREEQRRFLLEEEHFMVGMAAALFHDTGYLKDKGDLEGAGGKYTLVHVERGMEIARSYLAGHGWNERDTGDIVSMISITDYGKSFDLEEVFQDPRIAVLARMLATADLVAQIADTDYIRRIHDLFAEFSEAYEFEGTESLAKKGTKIFRTAKEIKAGTLAFYENFVLPTLGKFGGMDRYLSVFFGEGRNPYQENIAANLSSHLLEITPPWQRIGKVLEDMGMVSSSNIREALSRQRHLHKAEDSAPTSLPSSLRRELLRWFTDRSPESRCLGDILMDKGIVSPGALARGLLVQMLPDSLCADLSPRELQFLLQAAILLQNISKGTWILGVVLEMLNEILLCEASSILLADVENDRMLVVLPTGPKTSAVYGKGVSLDKGLASWVYKNHLPATVCNVGIDARFDRTMDKDSGFQTRSILAVPLHVHGECIGAVEAINKGNDTFTKQDQQILSILANMFANVMVGFLYVEKG